MLVERLRVAPGVEVTQEHALWLHDLGTIVITDLHLGYEGALEEAGVSIPRFQKKIMLERIARIIERYNPERVVVNGDFKHDFSKNLLQEWKDVLEVLDFLGERVSPVMVRGNHDNFLLTILTKRGIDLKKSIKLCGYTFMHGHEVTSSKGPVVIGHEHPAVKLRDEVGALLTMPAFVVSTGVIVLPAFSPLALGVDVSNYPYLSPVLNERDISDARVIALDEKEGLMEFGHVRDLKRFNASLAMK